LEEAEGLDEFAQMERLHARSGMDVPARLAALRAATVLHGGTCEKDEMRTAVLDFARNLS